MGEVSAFVISHSGGHSLPTGSLCQEVSPPVPTTLHVSCQHHVLQEAPESPLEPFSAPLGLHSPVFPSASQGHVPRRSAMASLPVGLLWRDCEACFQVPRSIVVHGLSLYTRPAVSVFEPQFPC